MLSYNEIKRGKIILYNEEPCKVLFNTFIKKNRNKGTNSVDLKSLISGKNFNVTFHSSDKIIETEVNKNDLKFLYQKKNEIWFSNPDNPKDRFFLPLEQVEEQIKFLKSNDVVTGLYFEDELISLEIPIKVELKVKESPPAVKGNTASGATKKVILENNFEVFVPLFIEVGDVVVVNTETGKYSERKKI